MKYIRSATVIFCFFIFGIGALILNYLLFPFIKNNKELCSDIIHFLWKYYVKFLVLVRLFKIEIHKLEKIENKIIVSTHPSFADILILMALIPRSTCFVKKELAHNPIIKNIVQSIFLTNETELSDLVEKSQEMLDRGFNLIIFPSGIRHRKNEFPKIKKGAALLAYKCEKNIVPIKLYSDRDFLFINQPFYAANDKTVTFELEQMQEINVKSIIAKTEIISKKKITDKITESLYG